MARRFTVSTRLETQDNASAGVERVEGRFRRLGNFIASHLVITLGDLTRVFGSVVRGLRSVIDAAGEQEDAVASLDASLARLGERGQSISKALQEQASALQQVTRFGDETIIKNQALLASFIDQEDVLKRATAAALYFAAGTGRDLTTAFEALAKASTGQVSSLSRYIGTIDDSIPKSEQFAAALERIEELFGGRAQRNAETFRGRVAQLSNAFGDAEEAIGGAVTGSEGFNEAIADVTHAVQAATPVVAELSRTLAQELSEGVREASDVLKGLEVVTRDFRPVVEESAGTFLKFATGALGPLSTAGELAFKTLTAIRDALAEAGRAAREQEQATAALADTERELAQVTDQAAGATERQADASARAAASVELLTKAAERAKRIQEDIANASKGFADEAERLGVVLDAKVNTAMQRNTAFLEQARELYSLGALSARELAEAETAVAQANDQLEASLSGTNVELEKAKTNSEAASTALDKTARVMGDVERTASRVNDVLADTSRKLIQVREFTTLTAAAFYSLGGAVDTATTRFVGFSTMGGRANVFLAPRGRPSMISPFQGTTIRSVVDPETGSRRFI
jgi:ABC-type transporter Mla subunit MlaD